MNVYELAASLSPDISVRRDVFDSAVFIGFVIPDGGEIWFGPTALSTEQSVTEIRSILEYELVKANASRANKGKRLGKSKVAADGVSED